MRGKKCSGPSASHGWHLVPGGRGGWRALTAIGVAGRNSRRKLKGKKKKKEGELGKPRALYQKQHSCLMSEDINFLLLQPALVKSVNKAGEQGN